MPQPYKKKSFRTRQLENREKQRRRREAESTPERELRKRKQRERAKFRREAESTPERESRLRALRLRKKKKQAHRRRGASSYVTRFMPQPPPHWLQNCFQDLSDMTSTPIIKKEILDPSEESETFILPDYLPGASVVEPVIKTEVVCPSEQGENLFWQNSTVESAQQFAPSRTKVSLSDTDKKNQNYVLSESKLNKCFVVLHDCLAPENLLFCSISANFDPLKINKDILRKRDFFPKKVKVNFPPVYFSPILNKNEALLGSKKTYSCNSSIHYNEGNKELSSIDLPPASEYLKKMLAVKQQRGNGLKLSDRQLPVYSKVLHSLPESGKSVEHFMEEFYLNHPDFGKI